MTILLLIERNLQIKLVACRPHNKNGKLLWVLFQNLIYISSKCHRLDIKISYSFWLRALQIENILPNIYFLPIIAKNQQLKSVACRPHNKDGKLLWVLFQNIIYISYKCHRLDIKISFSFWMRTLQSENIIPNIYFLPIIAKNQQLKSGGL